MKRLLRNTFLFLTVSILVLMGGMAVYATESEVSSNLADSTQAVQVKNTQAQQKQTTAKSAASFISSWFIQPFRNSEQSASEKLLSNVKVFPNPTVERINLSFRLGKRSDVSIKVMDALGNEMLTLFSQTLDPGNQNQSFEIQNRLSSGLYFVRVTAGTETVIKRISVL
mgnify:CR=1 FL=1